MCFTELYHEFTGHDIGCNDAEIEERLHSVPGIRLRGSLWIVCEGGESSHIAQLVKRQKRAPIKLRRFSTYIGRDLALNFHPRRMPLYQPQQNVTPTEAPNLNTRRSRSPQPSGRNMFRSARRNQSRESTKSPSQPRYRSSNRARSPPRYTRGAASRGHSQSSDRSASSRSSSDRRSSPTRRVRGRGPVRWRPSRSPSPRNRNIVLHRRRRSPSLNRFRSAGQRSRSPKRPAKGTPSKKKLEFDYRYCYG